jgi:hypothetical protein
MCRWLLLSVFALACGDDSSTADGGSSGRDGSVRSDASGRDGGSLPRDSGVIVRNPRFDGLADGAAIDLGPFECTSPAPDSGDCVSVTDYSGFVYDPRGHRFLMFGGGHATTMTDVVFAFDLGDTLRWIELYPTTPCESMTVSNLEPETGAWRAGPAGPFPRPLAAHTYDLLAVAPEQNRFILLSRLFNGGHCSEAGNDVGGPIANFDLDARTWSFESVVSPGHENIEASERDPMTGRFVILGSSGLSTWDPATSTAVQHVRTYDGATLNDSSGAEADMSALGYANHLTYYPPTDTFYYFVRGESDVWALALDRTDYARSTLDRISTTGPACPHQEPGYDYDAVSAIIGGGVTDGTFYAFDPRTATWSSHAIDGDPGTQAFHALGYDPIDNVFVFRTDYDSGSRTWAYRFRN